MKSKEVKEVGGSSPPPYANDMKFLFCYKPNPIVKAYYYDKLGEDYDPNKVVELYQKCLESFKKYYQVKVIDNFENEFLYQNDFKLNILKKYPDYIITDPDIILDKPLKIPEGFDVYVDFNYLNYTDGMEVMEQSIQEFKDAGFNLYENFFNGKYVTNLGFLYIPNENLRRKYIYLYDHLKKWLKINNVKFNPEHTMILGQVSLGFLIEKFDFKVCFLREYNEKRYRHYAGINKHRKSFKIPNQSLL